MPTKKADAADMSDFKHSAGEKGQAALDRYAPVKIGFLGAEFSPAYRNIHQMAFDIAKEEGWLPRNVEMIGRTEGGLPQGTAKNVVDGYMDLVEQGCIAIAGAYSSDNAMVLAPVAAKVQVPLLSWAGTDKLLNDWTFRLGNGDCGGDPAMMVHWLIREGVKRPGVIAEVSPNGEEYFNNFRRECLRWGLEIGGVQTAAQTTDNMEYHLGRLKDIGCDGLVHMGYGMHFVHDLMVPTLEALDWDPPRITTTAFMFYLRGMSKFNGWVGIDQYCPDNPRAVKVGEEYKRRFGEYPGQWPNGVLCLAFDTASVIAEAMFRAPMLNAEGMRIGFERIRFLPTATGGPRTHIAGAPGDHNLFKGDWLIYSKMVDGKLQFEGLFEPRD